MKEDPFTRVLARRLTRRDALATLGGAALGASAVLGSGCTAGPAPGPDRGPAGFRGIAGSGADTVRLPPGFRHDVVLGWGDSLVPGLPDLPLDRLASGAPLQPAGVEAARRSVGFNADAVHVFPLSGRTGRYVVCVNNEYVSEALMVPGWADHVVPGPDGNVIVRPSLVERWPHVTAYLQASVGVTVAEIERRDGRWRLAAAPRLNRRVTAGTPMRLSGPAAGHRLLCDESAPDGTRVVGTFGNCAGGVTPWGTYLTCEENVQDQFGGLERYLGLRDADPRMRALHSRFRARAVTSRSGWELTDPRFDLPSRPAELLRHGWVVEIDPYDPSATPVKRTALGRFMHESATVVLAPDGRVVVYSGDDDEFEYLYKFVSRERFDPTRPGRARHLLDEGTLHVARFRDDGTGEWLPLTWSARGLLSPDTGFADQGEVLIDARSAGDVLGATPMDRPEDIAVHPETGRVYVACTNNELRDAGGPVAGPGPGSPRAPNRYGHVLELTEYGDDPAAREFRWEVFLLCGDPAAGRLMAAGVPPAADPEATYYGGQGRAEGLAPIAWPDNLGIDPAGNLWIVTDGDQPRGHNNGCFAGPVSGPDRGRFEQFMSGPVGAEICGLEFTPDGRTLLLSVQHPGEGGTVEAPVSDWPDGGGRVPRPAVIAVEARDRRRFGS
jgi:hypothetical protein